MNTKETISTIKNAIKEDIGKGDITTNLCIPKGVRVKAVIIAKEPAVISGINIAEKVFKFCHNKIRFKPLVKNGQIVTKNKILAKIDGDAHAVLAGERTALNLLAHLSGIATLTRAFVHKIKPYKAEILDTRKTVPGIRRIEKYAVRCGGGKNHRMGLWDMILVKDNHIMINRKILKANTITNLIEKIKKEKPKNMKIEVEVKNLDEFKEALKAKPDIIMLDNMPLAQIKKAVKIKGNTQLEVSGGVNLKNVRRIAATGVDRISIGALTHSTKDIDVTLLITNSQISTDEKLRDEHR